MGNPRMCLASLASLAAVVSIAGACGGSATPTIDPAIGDAGPDATTPPADASATDAGAGVDAAPDATTPPDAGPCTATSDPRDGCIPADGTGIFVSPKGVPAGTADGSKARPFARINDAIAVLDTAPASTPGRIYVCSGIYLETVSLGKSLARSALLFGGLDCATWAYAPSATVRVRPPIPSAALIVKGGSSPLAIHDMTFEALPAAGTDGAGAGESSVAAVVDTSAVTFVRVALIARAGWPGTPGFTLVSNQSSDNRDGAASSGAAGARGNLCKCPNGSSSVGAGGADSGNPAQTGGGGDANPPAAVQPTKPNNDGGGGQGFIAGTQACTAGHVGANGAAGKASPPNPDFGTLVGDLWVPTPGVIGTAGLPGQGGGGGGGGAASGGGAGACGGCGGAAGSPGGGGGASIALVSVNSTVTLFLNDPTSRSQLTAGAGGNGGGGGDGEGGQSGGTGGASGAGGCGGGDGANGGGGGAGGGGGGGPSYGIAYVGTPPLIDGALALPTSTLPGITLGMPGAGGPPGVGGPAGVTGANGGIAGAFGAPGVPGAAKAIAGF